jgi:hypothetical protein
MEEVHATSLINVGILQMGGIGTCLYCIGMKEEKCINSNDKDMQ